MKKKIEETKNWITKNNKKSIGILVSVMLLIVIVPGTIVGIKASNDKESDNVNTSSEKKKTTSEKTNSKSNEKDNESETKSEATNVASKENTNDKTTGGDYSGTGNSSDGTTSTNNAKTGVSTNSGSTGGNSSGSENNASVGNTGSGSTSGGDSGGSSSGSGGSSSGGGTTTPPTPKPDPVKPTIPPKPSIPSDKKCGYLNASEANNKIASYGNGASVMNTQNGYDCISDYSWNGSSWNPLYKYDMPAYEIIDNNGNIFLVLGNGTVYPY